MIIEPLIQASCFFYLVKKQKQCNTLSHTFSLSLTHTQTGAEPCTAALAASLLQMLQRRADHPCSAAAGVTCRLGWLSGQPLLGVTLAARSLPLARPRVLMVVPRLLRKHAF